MTESSPLPPPFLVHGMAGSTPTETVAFLLEADTRISALHCDDHDEALDALRAVDVEMVATYRRLPYESQLTAVVECIHQLDLELDAHDYLEAMYLDEYGVMHALFELGPAILTKQLGSIVIYNFVIHDYSKPIGETHD